MFITSSLDNYYPDLLTYCLKWSTIRIRTMIAIHLRHLKSGKIVINISKKLGFFYDTC